MKPRVSFTVLGEKSCAANSNHRSINSPTVAVVRADNPRSASVIISLSDRCASRLPPCTVLLAYRFLFVTGSVPRKTRNSQASPRGRMKPFLQISSS